MLPPLLPSQRCSGCFAPSRFRPLSFPYWAFSVKKTLHTHLQSPHTRPLALLQLVLLSPAQPSAHVGTQGRVMGLMRDLREISQRNFELSLSRCRGGSACGQGEQDAHRPGTEGSPHPCGRVLWPSGKAGDATRKADRALRSLSKRGHAGPTGQTAAPRTPSCLPPVQDCSFQMVAMVPHVSPHFSTQLLTITLHHVMSSVTKLPVYPLMPTDQNLSCVAGVCFHSSLSKWLVSALGESFSPSTKAVLSGIQ